jgi:hypothetical protein
MATPELDPLELPLLETPPEALPELPPLEVAPELEAPGSPLRPTPLLLAPLLVPPAPFSGVLPMLPEPHWAESTAQLAARLQSTHLRRRWPRAGLLTCWKRIRFWRVLRIEIQCPRGESVDQGPVEAQAG